jgi:hypothetical protein
LFRIIKFGCFHNAFYVCFSTEKRGKRGSFHFESGNDEEEENDDEEDAFEDMAPLPSVSSSQISHRGERANIRGKVGKITSGQLDSHF